MDAQLEAKLIECLDALAQGESFETILARYPQDAAELRPMLETAARLSTLHMMPSEAAKMQSRQKFMAQADLLRRTSPHKTMSFLPRFATGFIAAVLVAAVLGTGAVAASGSALPGDPLYGLKRTVEDVQLNTASSPAARQELQQEFEQRRIDETNKLLDVGRQSEVEFTGTIEAMQPNAWIVSGLVVQLGPDTQIVGTPQINRMAEIRGVTGPNGLRASSISIESSGEPEVTSTPEAAETPEATETPELAETPAPTATPQPTTTRQPAPTPRPTAVPQPTDTPQPAEVDFSGSVDSINQQTWIIDGTTIAVTGDTEITGSINVGQRVKVKALRLGNGQLLATHIELADGGNVGDHRNGGSTPNPSPQPTEGHDDNHGGSTPEPTDSHGGDHGNSTPEAQPKPTDDHSN
jgi:hypothetical protein